MASKKVTPQKKVALLKKPSSSKFISIRSVPAATSIKSDANEVGADDFEAWMRSKTLLKPNNQLDLTPDEQREEILRILTTTNPQIPHNSVEFSYKERLFLPALHLGNDVELMNMDALSILKGSDEARVQMGFGDGILQPIETVYPPDHQNASIDQKNDVVGNEYGVVGREEDDVDEKVSLTSDQGSGKQSPVEDGTTSESGAPTKVEEAADDDHLSHGDKRDSTENEAHIVAKAKKILNQFNFCNQASLTYNNPIRDCCLQTEPPPRDNFSALAMQSTIFDAYEKDFEKIQKQKAKESEKSEKTEAKDLKSLKLSLIEEKQQALQLTSEITHQAIWVTRMTERIINQNTYDEIAQACRYWDDPCDEFQDTGSLLPLWRFSHERTKGHTVTSLCWNPCYYDLFAATFGSFDLRNQKAEGAVCLFTLKNPSYPEYICFCECGVMCVDIHPCLPHLLVVGRFDGNVAVYNVMVETTEPQHKSTIKSHKHSDVVGQVKWGPDTNDEGITFYSIGGDGRVFLWTLMKYYLVQTTIITLNLPLPPIVGPDGTLINMVACGTSFAFHPTDPLTFLIGTEEGDIYKCSTAYCSTPHGVYHNAHTMTVNTIRYNPFYPDIFISCSPDWRIKIWEDKRKDPLFVFEIGSSVVDVEWAPYSSTVFAAVSADGRVFVFDISVNIYEPICVQCDVFRTKTQRFTKLAFNRKLPFIIVGNEKGRITSLKLSPNLRKKVKPPKKGPAYTFTELEVIKLEKILSTVREPLKLEAPTEI